MCKLRLRKHSKTMTMNRLRFNCLFFLRFQNGWSAVALATTILGSVKKQPRNMENLTMSPFPSQVSPMRSGANEPLNLCKHTKRTNCIIIASCRTHVTIRVLFDLSVGLITFSPNCYFSRRWFRRRESWHAVVNVLMAVGLPMLAYVRF